MVFSFFAFIYTFFPMCLLVEENEQIHVKTLSKHVHDGDGVTFGTCISHIRKFSSSVVDFAPRRRRRRRSPIPAIENELMKRRRIPAKYMRVSPLLLLLFSLQHFEGPYRCVQVCVRSPYVYLWIFCCEARKTKRKVYEKWMEWNDRWEAKKNVWTTESEKEEKK